MELLSPTKQLTLPVQLRQDASFENFYGEANLKSVFLLKQTLSARDETLIYLAGAAGVGKTHLLCAAISFFEQECQHSSLAEEEGPAVCYFAMDELCEPFVSNDGLAELFLSFEAFSILALDNIDAWLDSNLEQRAEKERLLFNLFNHFKINGQQLLLSAKSVPSNLSVILPDLASRLKSGLLVSLVALSDVQKEVLLQFIAQQKGLILDDGLSAFIIKRSGRDIHALLMVLDQLDQASLTEQRRLTVPFAKKILNW